MAAQREGLFDYTILVALKPRLWALWPSRRKNWLGFMWTPPATARALAGLWPGSPGPDGTKTLTVEVLAGNLPALSLYRSLGFSQEKIVHGHMPGNEAFPVTVHCLTAPA